MGFFTLNFGFLGFIWDTAGTCTRATGSWLLGLHTIRFEPFYVCLEDGRHSSVNTRNTITILSTIVWSGLAELGYLHNGIAVLYACPRRAFPATNVRRHLSTAHPSVAHPWYFYSYSASHSLMCVYPIQMLNSLESGSERSRSSQSALLNPSLCVELWYTSRHYSPGV